MFLQTSGPPGQRALTSKVSELSPILLMGRLELNNLSKMYRSPEQTGWLTSVVPHWCLVVSVINQADGSDKPEENR